MMISTSKKAKHVSLNYNIEIMHRILDALYEMGKNRITDTVVYAGLNHNTTKRYLNLMKMFDWIELEKEVDHIVLRLTEIGNLFTINCMIQYQTRAFLD